MNRKLLFPFFTGLLMTFFANGQAPVAQFTASASSGCSPLVINFNDISTNGPNTLSWNFGGVPPAVVASTTTGFNPTVVFNNPGTYTVTLTATNSSGSNTSAPFTVNVFPSPTADFTANVTSGCFPLNVQYTDLSTTPGASTITNWVWDYGDGRIDTDIPNPVHTYTTSGNFPVTLYVKNSYGCSGSAALKTVSGYITVNNGVLPDFSQSVASSCNPPTSISFTNLTTGPPTISYKWDFGDGSAISTQTNPAHSYAAVGNYNVKLIASSNAGCTDSITNVTTITTSSNQSSFNVPDYVCVGSPVTFQNTSSPSPNTSDWDFGDGTTVSNQPNPTYTYTTIGDYTVTLSNNFSSCSGTFSKLIHVVNPPSATFSATNRVSCKPPLTVSFTDNSVGATSWFWDFGDGTNSTQQNPTHTYTKYGSFNVSLTASTASGCGQTKTVTAYVQVVAPTVNITNLPAYGCLSTTFTPTLSYVAVDGIASYAWNFGNGNTFNGPNPPAQVYTPGKYPVTVTITTNGGCTASFTDTVKVGTVKPTAAFTASPTTVCGGTPVQFTDQSTGGANEWLWDFGDGNTSSAQNPSYVYTVPGTYTVTLTAYNNGCYDMISKTNYIVVKPPYSKFGYSFDCTNKNQFTFSDSSVGATSWLWDFGDGSPTSTAQNPVHTYPAVAQTYTVTLTTGNSASGCTSVSTQTISVFQKVIINISANPACKNSLVLISTNHPANIVSYLFEFGDGKFAGAGLSGATSHVYTTPGDYIIKATSTDSKGCKDVSTAPIKITGPQVDFTAPVTQGCNSLTVSFTDLTVPNGGAIKTWFWDFGDGSTSTQQNPSHTYATQGTYPVKLKVTDVSGCTDSMFKSNYITLSIPKAKFTTADSMFCPSSNIKFTNASTGGFNPAYAWDFGNGNTYAGPNPPLQNYPLVGLYSVSLKVTDSYGCTDTYSKSNYITVDTPIASFKMDDSVSTCPPLIVHFTFTGHYNKTVQWVFGDGAISDTVNPAHLYGIPGTYYPTLTVISPGGCIAKIADTVQVFGPYGAFNYSPYEGCDSLTVNFNVVTSNVIKFTWYFGDGNYDSTTTPSISHKYIIPDKYIPLVVLEDNTGCRVPITGTNAIIVDSIKPIFKADRTVVCANGNVVFKDTSTKGNGTVIADYFWDFGDGNTLAGMNPNPTHYYAAPGSYSVKLIVTSQFGCKDSVTYPNYIKVVALPSVGINGGVSQCVPATFTFTGVELVPDTSVLTWAWDFDNGQTSNLQNPPAQAYDKPGQYHVQLTATNSSGCASVTATKDFYIYPLPGVNAGKDTTICLGTSAYLQATGGDTYNWLPPTNSSLSCSNCDNPVATPTVTTTYIVDGVSAFGCHAQDTIVVTVNQPVTVSVSPLADSVCLGQSTQLTATGAAIYSWTPTAGLSNPAIANPIATPTTTTTYQVTGYDDKYCFNDTKSVQVTVFNYPTINVGPDATILVGGSYQVNGSGSPDIVSINWIPVTGLDCTNCLSPLATPKKTTDYIVTAVNDGGCATADSLKITVICNNNNFFVPNTFSPNGDGMNDVFYVRGKGINIIPSIVIFNRWGQIVYERKDFAPNDPSAGWDGTFNGKPAPSDVYVYTIQIICDNSSLIPYHGNVTLIR